MWRRELLTDVRFDVARQYYVFEFDNAGDYRVVHNTHFFVLDLDGFQRAIVRVYADSNANRRSRLSILELVNVLNVFKSRLPHRMFLRPTR